MRRTWKALGVTVAGVALVLAAAGCGGSSGTTTVGAGSGQSASATSAGQVAGSQPASATGSASLGAPSQSTVAAKPSSVAPATPTRSRSTAASSPPSTAPKGARVFTFVNTLSQTIWVAAAQQSPQPALATTGWVLPAGQSLTITVPDKWNGRFWGRTGCAFDASGTGHCATGDCAGRFQCRGSGAIPATLAEYNLNSWRDLDFYDVSMVDGSNLPMYINIVRGPTKDPISPTGCSKAGCTKPVVCPKELTVDGGAGCESPCGVFGTDQYCCRGQWAPRSACVPKAWPVDYADIVFKAAEPYAYSYVDDDATSTFTCQADCDYRITFGVT